jgi:hypothetical protein
LHRGKSSPFLVTIFKEFAQHIGENSPNLAILPLSPVLKTKLGSRLAQASSFAKDVKNVSVT